MEIARYKMKYKIAEETIDDGNLRILGESFVKNNRNKGRLIINNKKNYLKEFIKIIDLEKSEIKIIILLNINISSTSCMFKDCKSLLELSNYDNMEKQNLIYHNIQQIVENKNKLEYEHDKSDENTFYMFKNLEDDNHYETSEIAKIEVSSDLATISNLRKKLSNLEIDYFLSKEMIYKSETISPSSGISYFNNLVNMSYMFYQCVYLESLPDISKWDISNCTDISLMFTGCVLLKSLPDISKWDISNCTDISLMFTGCISLISLPDISKWNTKNVNDMWGLFSVCQLSSLPDISKWNTANVTNMSYMFNAC